MADKIQLRYEELEELSKRIQREVDRVEVLIRNIRAITERLANSWLGIGATAFQREMEEDVLPAMSRLVAALEATGKTILQIVRIFQDADRDAIGFLSGVEHLGHGDSAAWQNNELLARDPHSLFKEANMDRLIGSRFKGAGGELGNVMKDLMKNPTGAELEKSLHRLADLRGRPYSEIKAEYEKFLQVRSQRDASGKSVADLHFHPFYMGRNTQLRYGSIVGGAFGIDPAFGAMLNPTGGIVMPDSWGFAGDSTALGYHGIVHDAAGYLYNYHGVGPGYDYLSLEGRDTSSPLSGQRAGIAYWTWKVGRYNPLNYTAGGAMVIGVGGWDLSKKFYQGVRGIF